ncbi:integrin alpha-PS2 isoform X2 [Toxorhynchites rutilus septentrionalis]|uniref:integrin alpha-PS2 isoform X2 n=1 Tax=Toxorhynchites rutilus septentrionalis TaxID=329112 RepID=UPI00247A5BF0|nr:integrin alpha-PS2 isoform X2 [Toxorhynchites rutilus septentrionalis]
MAGNDPGPRRSDGGSDRINGGRSRGIANMHLFLLVAITWLACGQLNLSVEAFNVDTVNYVLHEGSPNSMFGFSVVLHQEQQRSWVIIGAPTADTSAYQEGVVNGGAVYRCDISDDNRCNLIPFDAKGNSFNDKHEQVDTKSNQWFGATVASAGVDGPLVACAPRYVFHQLQPRKVERVEPVGTCFIARNNMQQFDEYSPCRTMYWGYHRQGSCQAGFSASLTKSGDRVFVGAPGSYYWQGQIYSFSLNNPRDKVYSTGESTSLEDDSYLGYSSATGDFNGSGNMGVAVGMPRGGGLLGKVLIFSWNMTNQQNITGEQIGAYFGYAIAVVDVDGDKLDDLIVGAPMYTEPNNEGKYETGRVYIIYQDKVDKFQEVETRDGVNSKARFGLSVCSLGDINLDGFGDFAVGAPYDGPHGRGAVYVYHGSPTGPLAKPSQVILAEDISGVSRISTFGFSVAGGIDLDGNQYPDMVVGAYETDKALVFKSRPVAVMEASALFETENKLISLEDRNCTLRDQKQVPCTVVNSCMKYNGINVPPTLDIEVSWVLDSKKSRNARMYFLNEEGRNIRNQSMRLYRGKLECKSERVYIADNIRDKITPLEVEMKYSLRQSSFSQQRRRRATVEPVLDQNRGTVQKDSINIQKNCGPDNVCIPDLRLQVNTVDEYLLGSGKLLGVDVLISNFGEDAFEAGFYMTIPPELNFRRVEKVGEIKDTPILCTPPPGATNGTLKCDIGNPLSSGKVVNFKILLSPSIKVGMAPSYDFYMEANSTNAESDGSHMDNIFKKSVGITIKTDLSISGVSLPEDFLYNYTQYRKLEEAETEHHLGPQVVHIYEIRNEGPSTIDEAEFFVLWPYETHDGDPLMYLLVAPETSGNIKCQPSSYINPRDLAIENPRKSYLEKVGASSVNHDSGSRTEYRASSGSSSGTSSTGFHRQSTSGGSSYRGTSSSSSSGSSFSSGSSSSTSSRAGGSQAVLTDTDKRRLDDEENQESTGDASYVHRQRAESAAAAAEAHSQYAADSQRYRGEAGRGNRNGTSREYSYSSSWNSSSVNGGPVATYSASRNRTTYRGEDGRVRVSESSTEHYGKSVAAFAGVGANVDGQTLYKEDFSDVYRQDERGGVVSASNVGSSSVNAGGHRQSSSAGASYGHSGGASASESSRVVHTSSSSAAGHGGSFATSGRGNEIYRSESSNSESGSSRATGGGHRHGSSSGASQVHSSSDRVDESSYSESSRAASGSSSSSASSRGGSSGPFGHGSELYKSESSHTEEVNQDISGLGSRSSSSTQGGEMSVSGASSSSRRRMKSQQDGEATRPDLITGVSTIERLAQGRGGFQTATLDLGTLNRQNVDEEIRTSGSARASGGRNATYESHGSAHGGASSSQYGQQHGGSTHYSSSLSSSSAAGRTHSSSSHSSTTGGQDSYSRHQQNAAYGILNEEDGDEYVDEYDEGDDGGYVDQSDTRGYGTSYQHHSRSHLNQGHENVDQKFKYYQQFDRRQRRQAPGVEDANEQALNKALQCQATRCAIIRCLAGPIGDKDVAFIGLRTRVVAHTLHKISSGSAINFSTMTVARVTRLPYIGQPKEMPLKTHEIQVKATPEPTPKPDVVPLWIVVLAACAGTIILLLLVYLLSKCGFFNRNRPTDSSERQPLNRNGNYHGDEHL